MKRFFLIPFMLLLVLLPLACQKTYTVGPLAPTPVPAFTSTPTQNPFCTVVALPTAGTIPNGIVWGAAEIMSTDYIGLHLDVSVMLYLAVNGAPESTDAVTMSGPGYAGPVSYNGPATVSGDVFAFYTSPAAGITLVAGAPYTLTTVTSIGTATSVVTAPADPFLSADGYTATWAGPSMFNQTEIYNTIPNEVWSTPNCVNQFSPLSIPVTAYTGSASGTYYTYVNSVNYTTTVTGGKGLFVVDVACERDLSK